LKEEAALLPGWPFRFGSSFHLSLSNPGFQLKPTLSILAGRLWFLSPDSRPISNTRFNRATSFKPSETARLRTKRRKWRRIRHIYVGG